MCRDPWASKSFVYRESLLYLGMTISRMYSVFLNNEYAKWSTAFRRCGLPKDRFIVATKQLVSYEKRVDFL